MSQQVTFADYLLCLEFYRKLDEKKFTALLEKVKPVAARDPVDLALLMDWLNQERPRRGSAEMEWRNCRRNSRPIPPPAVAIAEAFADAKNWSRLKRWTRSGALGRFRISASRLSGVRREQSRQSAADAEFSSLWRSAERAAAEHPDREVNLARLATKWGLTG